MRHTKHLWRAGIILVGALAGAVVARSLLVPATYGQYGSYRGADLETQKSKPLVHGAPGSCTNCHTDQSMSHDAGEHKTVTCESCHAPLSTHVKGDKVIAKMITEKQSVLCLRCHRKDDARPKDFPQIDLNTHMQDNGVDYNDDICFACHNPHNPREGLPNEQ